MTQPPSLTIALLFSTPGTAWGGLERHTADLARALANRGHRIHVIGHRNFREHFPTGVQFHAAPVQLGRRNPWLRYALGRLIRQIAPDILHAQGNKSAQLLRAFNPNNRCARVGTVHGTKSSHRAFQGLDRVIAVSPHIFDTLDHPRKQLIFNGISQTLDGDLKSDENRILPENTVNVVAIGRLEPVKGFETLIRAWTELAANDTAVHLSIFGDGSLKSRLFKLIASLGLEDRITLAGFRADLEPVYRQADLVVISSRREGFPYVLIESLLAGCPIVSTPVSGPAYLLPAQALSPDWEPSHLADRLRHALANLPGLKEAESAAMTFAREKLTLECMAIETERLYCEALTARDGGNT